MPNPNRASNGAIDVVLPSQALTTSGSLDLGSAWGPPNALRMVSAVTAMSGTAPTLDLILEDTLDDGATWNPVITVPQFTAPGRNVQNVAQPFANRLRIRWTVGGTTPSATTEVRIYSE